MEEGGHLSLGVWSFAVYIQSVYTLSYACVCVTPWLMAAIAIAIVGITLSTKNTFYDSNKKFTRFAKTMLTLLYIFNFF